MADAATDHPVKPWRDALKAFKREYLAAAISDAGSITDAAKQLGIARQHLHKAITALNIRTPRPVHRGRWDD